MQVVPLEIGEQRLLARPLVLAGFRFGSGRPGEVHPEAASRATDTTARTVVSYPGRPCEQLGLGFVQLGLHVLWLLSRAVA